MHSADPVRMTYENLVALPDDGLRHELIDGVHYVSPSPALPPPPRPPLLARSSEMLFDSISPSRRPPDRIGRV